MFDECLRIGEELSEFKGQWGIAGGWAIDLFIGKGTRPHSDIEIAIFRKDQHLLKETLSDWSFEKVVNGAFADWGKEWLELPVHEIHGAHKKSGKQLEVLLNETKNNEWIFRRDLSITFPKSSFFLQSDEGIPYLHPAVVLLYKAKNTRVKDHADFHSARGLLTSEDRKWLYNALQIHMSKHEWIRNL